MNKKLTSLITFTLIGVAAYMLTDIIHEVIGHGGVCLLIGQKITLLTSVYFRSEPGSVITDLGGPISNLLAGLVLFYILKHRKDLPILTRLLLFLTMSYCFYWFSGTILQSSFSKTGDWTYAVKQLNIGPYGKPLLIILGIIAYHFSIKLSRIHLKKIDLFFTGFPLRQFIFYSYFSAALAATIAGLFFSPNRISAAREGLFEMIASLPILFIIPQKEVKVEADEIKLYNFAFNFIVIILFVLFCVTLGKGFIM